MKTPSSFLATAALGSILLAGSCPLAFAQTKSSFSPTPAVAQTKSSSSPTPAVAPSPKPTPTRPGVVILPEPAPTPGKPYVPDAEAARGQTAVSAVRRLVRDVQSNTDNIKAVGNFGAQLYLINSESFYTDWRKPETPNITPVQLTLRGQPIYTAVIFYGPGRDDKGLCQVTYDVTVKRPDGTVLKESKSMVGWQNLAPDERELMLGRNYLNIAVPETDPVGVYTVEMVVHDTIGRVDLPLKQTFAVQ